MRNFFAELKRRHIFRVGIAYLVVAWLVVQLVNNLVPLLGVPVWIGKAVLIFLIAGFPVALVLAWAFELTPEGVKRVRDTGEEVLPAAATSFGRKLDFVIIAALVLALGYFVWDRYYGAPVGQTAEQTAPAGQSETATGTPSLAVLPFADLSPKKDQGYFADGVTEELLNSLARIKGLEVTGRTSSFYFKDKNEDLRTIGKTLAVQDILEGSIRKDGDQLRITAQLINAETGYHLWSQTYDRKFTDILNVQEEIAKAVADALQIRLGIGELGERPGMTRNPDAYDAFLQGKDNPDRSALANHRNSIDALERAVALDPNFGLAWLSLSGAYNNAEFNFPGQIGDAAAKAKQAFGHARALIPDSPEVLIVSAEAAFGDETVKPGDARLNAESAFDKAMAAVAENPNDRSVEGVYADFLTRTGRFKEAISHMEHLRAIEPLDGNIAAALAGLYVFAGDAQAALAEADRGLKLKDGQRDVRLAGLPAAFESGDRTVIEKWVKIIEAFPFGDKSIGALNRAMAQRLDDPAAARAELQRLGADPTNDTSPLEGAMIIRWAAILDDPAFALTHLRGMSKAFQHGYAFLTLGPLYREVRKLPGYKDFLREVGLVDYWRKSGHWADICHPAGDGDFACD